MKLYLPRDLGYPHVGRGGVRRRATTASLATGVAEGVPATFADSERTVEREHRSWRWFGPTVRPAPGEISIHPAALAARSSMSMPSDTTVDLTDSDEHLLMVPGAVLSHR